LSLAGVEFSEWLLLETLNELETRSKGGVPQAIIAQSAGLTRQVASYWLTCMAERGVVDRGPTDDPRCWCVIITKRGEALLRLCHERLEAAGLSR
jgi:DNA-binding MarR family transcriptional regulator